MENSRKVLVHLFLVVLFFVSQIFATSQKLKMPVEIKDIIIVSNDDNNLQIEVEYQTNR